jgi:hypothetical protein
VLLRVKAPGYREDGVDRFLTWNLLFGSKDGTDYTLYYLLKQYQWAMIIPAAAVGQKRASSPGSDSWPAST